MEAPGAWNGHALCEMDLSGPLIRRIRSRFGPFDQFRLVLIIEDRITVYQSVAGQRHFATLNGFSDVPPSLARP